MKPARFDLNLFMTSFCILAGIYNIILVLNGYVSSTITIIWTINAIIITILSYILTTKNRKYELTIEQYKKIETDLSAYCTYAYKYNVDCVKDLQCITEHSKNLLDFSIKRTPFEEIPPLFMAVDLQIEEIRNRYAKP